MLKLLQLFNAKLTVHAWPNNDYTCTVKCSIKWIFLLIHRTSFTCGSAHHRAARAAAHHQCRHIQGAVSAGHVCHGPAPHHHDPARPVGWQRRGRPQVPAFSLNRADRREERLSAADGHLYREIAYLWLRRGMGEKATCLYYLFLFAFLVVVFVYLFWFAKYLLYWIVQ